MTRLKATKTDSLKTLIDKLGLDTVAEAVALQEDANFYKTVVAPAVKKAPASKGAANPPVKPASKPVASQQTPSLIETTATNISNQLATVTAEIKRNVESVPGMLERAWIKYGWGDAAKSETSKVEGKIVKVAPQATKSEVAPNQLPITPMYKELGTTKEGYYSYINLFDNNKGFNYVPTVRIEKDSSYQDVQGMAHFLFDYDMTTGVAADKSRTKSMHSLLKRKSDGSLDKEYIRKTYKPYQPGSTVKDPYYTIYKTNPDKTVNIKYKKLDEINKEDKIGDELRQYRFTDINWNSQTKAVGFNESIGALATKDNQSTYLIFAKGLGKDAYGKYGGGSVVFLIEGTNIAVDFAGSLNQIKNQGLELIKQFNIPPEKLIVAYHDLGSYSAKPDDINGVLRTSRYFNFNTNKQTGAGIAIPKSK